jgi:hypothetical protein
MRRARQALGLAAALLLHGCTRSGSAAGPVPLAIIPSQGTGLAPLAVTIAGNHLDAAATTDFAGGAARLDATFKARLLPEAGGAAIALAGVRLTEDHRLLATVPAGIARGGYALEVTDPAGRVGLLLQAFRVVVPAEALAAFRVEPAEPAHAGVPFLVKITAVDGAGTVVDGFTGSARLTDLTGTLSPATAGPFACGVAELRVTVASLTAADRLGHAGTSASFAVLASPPVAVVFTSVPATLTAGTCATASIGLRDALGFVAVAANPLDVQLQASPAGGVAFHAGGGACNTPNTSVAFAAGASSATFRFVGGAPGAAAIRLVPSSLPSATQPLTFTP